jgi:transcriptional regulator with XRE-family HTH domain
LSTVSSGLSDISARIGRSVRAYRTAAALSLGGLAREAGLSKTILSRIEAGEGNPSVETLWRLSQAFDLPLGALLTDEAPQAARRIPARSGRRMGAQSGMAAWLVHAEGRPSRCELYELELAAGVTHPGRAHLPGTNEVIFCLKGRMLAGPDGDEVELRPGDAATFGSDAPHRYVALRDTRALCLMLYPDP